MTSTGQEPFARLVHTSSRCEIAPEVNLEALTVGTFWRKLKKFGLAERRAGNSVR